MLGLYNALLVLAAIVGLPLWLGWLLVSPRARAGLGERLALPPRAAAPGVWVHAASVGEVEAAVPVIDALLERGIPVRASALTLAGRARLRARFPEIPARLAPLDLPGLVHAALRRARARVLVLVETELWPNWVAAAAGAGARVVMVGARISDRSLPRYRALRPLFGPLLARMTHVGARSSVDRDRLIALGARRECSSVVGDLKLDRPPAPQPSEELRKALGPGPFLVAGSTHAGEEEALLASLQALREAGAGDLRLVLAPRHLERVEQVIASARRFGVSAGRRSAGSAAAEVVVLDTLGELGTIYHVADLAFVGGSLAPVGGHNLLEPVQAGKVVVHGPHVENQRAQVALLAPLGVLHQADDARALAAVLARLWSDPARNAPAVRARAELERHRGAAARALACVLEAWADDV